MQRRIHRVFFTVSACGAVALGAIAASASPAHAREFLYAAAVDLKTGAGSVLYYDAYAKQTSPRGSIAISSGYPDGVWTDSRGRVYVAVIDSPSNPGGFIDVFAPGLTTLLGVYTSGIDEPSGGAFDGAGNMYVSNLCGVDPSSCGAAHWLAGRGSTPFPGYIAVFRPHHLKPFTILQGLMTATVGVAVDSADNVFAADRTDKPAWKVIEFPVGESQPHVVRFRELPKRPHFAAVTFAPSGALVTGLDGAIDIFPHEQGKSDRTLTQGVVSVDGLAYGSDGTLFAANYEFKSGEGNVIAFPPRTTSPARTYDAPMGYGIAGVAVGPGAP